MASGTVTDLALPTENILLENDPATPYPGFDVISVKSHSVPFRRRTIMRWDLSGELPGKGSTPTCTISNATLEITWSLASGSGDQPGWIRRYNSDGNIEDDTWNSASAGGLLDGVASPSLAITLGTAGLKTYSGAELDTLVEEAINDHAALLTLIIAYDPDNLAFYDFTQAPISAVLLSFDWVDGVDNRKLKLYGRVHR